jgi:hypothetical protein
MFLSARLHGVVIGCSGVRSPPEDGIRSAHLTARPRPQQTRTCDHRHDRLVRALIECWRPRIVYLAFGLIGDSLHPRSRVATKNPRAARNRGACPTPPRPASEERQGSKEDRQRNLWQGNEDHLSIPLPLIPLPNQMGHRQDATDLTTASRPRNFCARLDHATLQPDNGCRHLARGVEQPLPKNTFECSVCTALLSDAAAFRSRPEDGIRSAHLRAWATAQQSTAHLRAWDSAAHLRASDPTAHRHSGLRPHR